MAAFERLTRQQSRGTSKLPPLTVDTLRPLIDLAYWSTFVEVRRDSSAALCTVSMNENNLEILSKAGALGAILALIGANNRKNDVAVQKDAATALANLIQLDSIKQRLLSNKVGLATIFFITRSQNKEIKRSAIKALDVLSQLDAAKLQIVQAGGLKHIFPLTTCRDERTKRFAARVLKRLAAYEPNQSHMADPATLKYVGDQMSNPADTALWSDLIEFIMKLSTVKENRSKLVKAGLIDPLIFALSKDDSSMDTCHNILKCMSLLATEEENHEVMIHSGALDAISSVAFVRIPNAAGRRSPKLSGRNSPRPGSSASSHSTPSASTTHSASNSAPRGDVQRICMMIVEQLALNKANRDMLVSSEIFGHLLSSNVANSDDKRIRRSCCDILKNLSSNGGMAASRHSKMVEQGLVHVLGSFLHQPDVELNISAAITCCQLTPCQTCRKAVIDAGLVPMLIKLAHLPDLNLKYSIALACAELTSDAEFCSVLIDAGCVPALAGMLTDVKKGDPCQSEACRALRNLCQNDFSHAEDELLTQNVLSHAISVSRNSRFGPTDKINALSIINRLQSSPSQCSIGEKEKRVLEARAKKEAIAAEKAAKELEDKKRIKEALRREQEAQYAEFKKQESKEKAKKSEFKQVDSDFESDNEFQDDFE
eukprot:TRINITY_DN2024_c0_g1_i2.p1 TRINITY_DN2024_c0_g1~~TRINITY_DN2024_c0_g1_i2.p1  ORF type:complete len:655 (+),score=177.75 TRINITY_DN2024_c0_g1_i2:192-2156(+)